MGVVMIRSKVKAENAADVQAAVGKMFGEIAEVAPQGVRYASCVLPDGVTYIALLELENGPENPLAALPEFRNFQESLKGWLAEPPVVQQLTPVGSYRLF
jgi:hypothetical protein